MLTEVREAQAEKAAKPQESSLVNGPSRVTNGHNKTTPEGPASHGGGTWQEFLHKYRDLAGAEDLLPRTEVPGAQGQKGDSKFTQGLLQPPQVLFRWLQAQ